MKFYPEWSQSGSHVCIGSHAFAMFAHKKSSGCTGYVDDPLPNIAYMGIWMPIVRLYFASSLIIWCFSDHILFLLSVWCLERSVASQSPTLERGMFVLKDLLTY